MERQEGEALRSVAREAKSLHSLKRSGAWARQKEKKPGVSVFVNYVRKRIHQTTLKDAFSEYGKVIDTYIAYHNLKRIKNNYTFAFVRFACWEDAVRAVERGNNRRMGGFCVKVYIEKKDARLSETNIVPCSKAQKSMASNKSFARKVTNERSFKDVLLGITQEVEKVSAPSKEGCFETDITLQIPFSPSEANCLKNSFVGQVKGMYNADFVQEALRSDGFNIKVSTWSGFYVIVQCLEVEQVEIFWDLKKSLMESWFEDIDTVDNFLSKKKLKIWVNIEGLPLFAWHATVIESIAKKWGHVVKIDDDTLARNRFDVARVLLGVTFISDVPTPLPLISMETSSTSECQQLSSKTLGAGLMKSACRRPPMK
ncbi:hypothetical protein GQ457_18G015890 [Hibiscus cannabinus]